VSPARLRRPSRGKFHVLGRNPKHAPFALGTGLTHSHVVDARTMSCDGDWQSRHVCSGERTVLRELRHEHGTLRPAIRRESGMCTGIWSPSKSAFKRGMQNERVWMADALHSTQYWFESPGYPKRWWLERRARFFRRTGMPREITSRRIVPYKRLILLLDIFLGLLEVGLQCHLATSSW